MKAPVVVSSLFAAALVATPVSAQQLPIEQAVENMVSQLAAATTYELKAELDQAIANTVYFFQPMDSETRTGKISVTDLTASRDTAGEVETAVQ